MTQNLEIYFELPFDVKDSVYNSKALRDIWTLIEYMSDDFRNTIPNIFQKAPQKIRIATSPCHVVNHVFIGSPFDSLLFNRFLY